MVNFSITKRGFYIKRNILNIINHQKSDEREALKLWMRLARDVPKAKVVSSESPDFLLFTSPRQAIGVEVTKLMLFGQELVVAARKAEVVRLFSTKLNAVVSKKSELFQLYNANPKLAEIWLLIVVDGGFFEVVHRQLHDIGRSIGHPFSRIDLLFPDAEKVLSL